MFRCVFVLGSQLIEVQEMLKLAILGYIDWWAEAKTAPEQQ